MSKTSSKADKGRRGSRPVLVLLSAAFIGVAAGIFLERINRDEEALHDPPPVAEDAIPAPIAMGANGRPEKPAAMARLPVYPGAAPQALGDSATLHGIDINMAWFTTPDSPQQVLSWYRQTLAEAGHYVLSSAMPGGARYVGFHDAEANETNTVTIMDFGGETLVFPALGRRGDVRRSEEIPQDLPHPEDARSTSVLRLSERGTTQYTVAARSSASIQALLDFYRKGFISKGWTLEEVTAVSPKEGRVAARYGRGAALVILARNETAGFPVTQIHVNMTKQGSRLVSETPSREGGIE